MSTHIRLLVLLVALSPLLAPGRPVAAATLAGARCFDETGFCISDTIAAFWTRNGGLPVFGFPISPVLEAQVEGRTRRVQWFERTRLELHPEHAPPFNVQIGRVGVEALTAQGRDWQTFPRSGPQDGCRFFPATGQSVCGAILAAWRAQGLEFDGRAGVSEAESLALQGMPISPPQHEQLGDGQRYEVQWFERARFELHPEQPPQTQVQLGLLGNDLHPTATGSPVPQLALGRCPFTPPANVRVDCGALIVPQQRSQPMQRSVALAVAIFRDPSPAPDPIIYLSGGPGSAALASAPGNYRAWRAFAAGRDLVFVDQRGTGFSWPSLRCPELDAVDSAALREEAEALLRCRDRLEGGGTRMAAYNSAASAADLADLRAVLGYERWNVFGISYGTRLALTMLRDTPGTIRSVMLDSPYPLQANLYTSMPANLDRSLQVLFTACAVDERCKAAYPDLEHVFYGLVDALNAQPAQVNLNGAQVRLTGDRLVGLTFRLLYRSTYIPRLPQMIYAASAGQFGPLQELTTQRLQSSATQAEAMYYAVQCAEELAFSGSDEIADSVAAYPRLAGFYAGLIETSPIGAELCGRFGVGPPDPRENEPVRSSIPTLLLSGEYDPITPPQWRELAGASLDTSYGYTFPGTGHAVIGRGACPAAIMRAFLAAPEHAPDGTCAAQLGGPAFVIR